MYLNMSKTNSRYKKIQKIIIYKVQDAGNYRRRFQLKLNATWCIVIQYYYF